MSTMPLLGSIELKAGCQKRLLASLVLVHQTQVPHCHDGLDVWWCNRSSLDKHLNPLSIAHMWCSRQICGTSMRDHITNQYILMRCEPLSVKSQSEARGLDGLLITAGCLTAGHASGRRAELPALMGRMCIGFDSCRYNCNRLQAWLQRMCSPCFSAD